MDSTQCSRKRSDASIRVCSDFSNELIKGLENHKYSLPITDNIFPILNSRPRFAKLDITKVFLLVEVSTDTWELLTINTYRGLFRFTRLTFGVKTAPGIYLKLRVQQNTEMTSLSWVDQERS